MNVCYGLILLKKSVMAFAAEKYASEIEIFTFGRVFQTQISRSSVQKRRFHQSMIRQFGMTDFFNRIGRFLPLMTGKNRPIPTRRIPQDASPKTGRTFRPS
jgi:hypothetical protein